jgi:alpha-aminoadipate/glutamate carrier protein LysW
VSYCPECEAVIDEELEDVGEIISCPECGVELEVISIDPVEFDLAPVDDEEDDEFRFDDTEDEEEWDDEEDSYDEDGEEDDDDI